MMHQLYQARVIMNYRPRLECRRVVPAILFRLQERIIKNELAVLQDEIRQFFSPFEWSVIVRDIVVGRDGEHDNVGREFPNALAQSQQLLDRSIAANAKVEDLNILS